MYIVASGFGSGVSLEKVVHIALGFRLQQHHEEEMHNVHAACVRVLVCSTNETGFTAYLRLLRLIYLYGCRTKLAKASQLPY